MQFEPKRELVIPKQGEIAPACICTGNCVGWCQGRCGAACHQGGVCNNFSGPK